MQVFVSNHSMKLSSEGDCVWDCYSFSSINMVHWNYVKYVLLFRWKLPVMQSSESSKVALMDSVIDIGLFVISSIKQIRRSSPVKIRTHMRDCPSSTSFEVAPLRISASWPSRRLTCSSLRSSCVCRPASWFVYESFSLVLSCLKSRDEWLL